MRRVVIDGGSGAGKTTIGRRLTEAWTRLSGEPVQLVSLDSFYPGWHGLAAASRMVVDDVLHPTRPGYRRWDWVANQPTDWVDLDPERPMVIEGCGALTPASAARVDLTIWVELDAAERKRRALGRDGDGYAPWWDTWAAQEAEHWKVNSPQTLAQLVVDALTLNP